MHMKEKAVSEAIGYIIIFGLVMTGIGLITLYGYPVLMQQESQANIKNMEQTMIVLQNDIKSLTYKLVPYKETTLRVGGGTLSLVNRSTMAGNGQSFDISYAGNSVVDGFIPGELRYVSTKDNVVIGLENGAVMERTIGTPGSFMLADPRWYVDEDAITNEKTMVVNLVEIGSLMEQPYLSQTGVGTVRMRHFQTLYRNPTGVPDPGAPVVITYDPSIMESGAYDYSQAWRNFLTDPSGLAMTEGPTNTYTRNGITNLVVKQYDLIVEEL